jgi:hypothetical protein
VFTSTVILALVILFTLSDFRSITADRLRLLIQSVQQNANVLETNESTSIRNKTIVVSKASWEDTNWVSDNFPE